MAKKDLNGDSLTTAAGRRLWATASELVDVACFDEAYQCVQRMINAEVLSQDRRSILALHTEIVDLFSQYVTHNKSAEGAHRKALCDRARATLHHDLDAEAREHAWNTYMEFTDQSSKDLKAEILCNRLLIASTPEKHQEIAISCRDFLEKCDGSGGPWVTVLRSQVAELEHDYQQSLRLLDEALEASLVNGEPYLELRCLELLSWAAAAAGDAASSASYAAGIPGASARCLFVGESVACVVNRIVEAHERIDPRGVLDLIDAELPILNISKKSSEFEVLLSSFRALALAQIGRHRDAIVVSQRVHKVLENTAMPNDWHQIAGTVIVHALYTVGDEESLVKLRPLIDHLRRSVVWSWVESELDLAHVMLLQAEGADAQIVGLEVQTLFSSFNEPQIAARVALVLACSAWESQDGGQISLIEHFLAAASCVAPTRLHKALVREAGLMVAALSGEKIDSASAISCSNFWRRAGSVSDAMRVLAKMSLFDSEIEVQFARTLHEIDSLPRTIAAAGDRANVSIVKEHPLMSGASDALSERIAREATIRTIQVGEPVATREGDHPGLVIVLEGCLGGYVEEDANGDPVLDFIVGSGEVFGFDAAYSDSNSAASVIACERTQCAIIAPEALRRILEDHSALALLLVEWQQRMYSLHTALRSGGAREVGDRVRHLLSQFDERFGGSTIEGTRLIPVTLSQQQLAHLVGASRKSLSLALSDLRASGSLRTSSTHFELV